MPSKSKKQARAMGIAAAGKGNIGIPQKVAQEFVAADKRSSNKKRGKKCRKKGRRRN